jgi:hypothetical protein
VAIVKISEVARWPSARWVFTNVFEQTLLQLRKEEPLYGKLELALKDGMCYLDLTTSSKEEKRRLLGAVQSVLETTQRNGPGSFASPEFYPGYVDRIKELVEMLERE